MSVRALVENYKCSKPLFYKQFSTNARTDIIHYYEFCNNSNFDRHFTTSNSLSFTVTNIACRISGARIMLQGEELYYEIAMDLLLDFMEKENQTFEFLEKYSENVYRKTILKFLI